jgi:hypothetical protein
VTTRREYEPIWVQQTATGPAPSPLTFENGAGRIKNSSTDAMNQAYELTVDQSSLIRAHTLYFPGWTLKIDGKQQPIMIDLVTGEMLFTAAPGQHHVTLELVTTSLQARSMWLSILTLVLLILIGLDRWLAFSRRFGRAYRGELGLRPATASEPSAQNQPSKATPGQEIVIAGQERESDPLMNGTVQLTKIQVRNTSSAGSSRRGHHVIDPSFKRRPRA